MGVKQPSFRIVALLCLLLCALWAGLVSAHGECPPETGDAREQLQEGRPAHSEQVAAKAEDAGLKKVLTTRNPRRTDIPDYMLVIMLALVGIVVISRRDVSGRGQKTLSRGQPYSDGARGEGEPF